MQKTPAVINVWTEGAGVVVALVRHFNFSITFWSNSLPRGWENSSNVTKHPSLGLKNRSLGFNVAPKPVPLSRSKH